MLDEQIAEVKDTYNKYKVTKLPDSMRSLSGARDTRCICTPQPKSRLIPE